MNKTLIFSALCAVLVSGCAIVVPPTTPETIAASKHNDYWGALSKYIDATYASASDTLSITNPGDGTLRIIATDSTASTQRIDVSLGTKPGTYYVNAPGAAFVDHAGLVRFDADGRMQQIEGNLGQHYLTITDSTARLWSPYGIRQNSLKRVPQTYTLDDGTTLPISEAPGSALRKLHDSLPGFGLWETTVGQTFVGDVDMLRVDKTQEGHLRLVTLSLEGNEGFQLIFDKEPGHKGSAAKYASTSTQIKDVVYNQTELRMRSGYEKKDYRWRYFLQGDQILEFTSTYHPDNDEPTLTTTVYRPLTEAGMLTAMERRTKGRIKAAEETAYAERRAAERASERRATEASIVTGLARGFAQAQQSNNRLNQMSQDFERNLNNNLRQIKSEQDKQRETARAFAASIMAANDTARQAAPRATLAGNSPSQVAQAGPAVSSSRQAARPQPQARQREEDARREQKTANATDRQAPTPSSASTLCRTVDDGVLKWSEFGSSRKEAEKNMRSRAGAGMCLHRGGVVGLSVGQCTEQKNTRTEVDTSVPGKLSFNRIPVSSTWQCAATYRCAQPKQVCDNVPARATRQ